MSGYTSSSVHAIACDVKLRLSARARHSDFLEDAIANHVPNPQLNTQSHDRQRSRRTTRTPGSCCATQRVREGVQEGVPPTSSPQMDLSHDAVKPPPTWSCGSKPARHRAASAGRRPHQTSGRGTNRNAMAAPRDHLARRRGGTRFGLCGSRPHQAQQGSTATSQDESQETSLEHLQATASGDSAATIDPESAKWNEKSRAARATISTTEHKMGSQEWYRSQRQVEKRIIDEASEGLPEGWEVLLSHSHKGALYYRNVHSGDTTWIRPLEPAAKVQKAADSDSHKCTVHVGGLDQFKFDHRVREYEEQLVEEFSQFGEVLQAQVRIRRRTESDGSVKVSWALVTFLNASMAQSAVDGVKVLNRRYPGIVVKIVDESIAKTSSGAMGSVLEKAQIAEQEKLKVMLQSLDDEGGASSGSVRFGGAVYSK